MIIISEASKVCAKRGAGNLPAPIEAPEFSAGDYLTQKLMPNWPGTSEDARTETFEYPPSVKYSA